MGNGKGNDHTDYTDRNAATVGLCETCRHSTAIQNDRGSRFYMCERSRTDPRFPRYPRLPIVACVGYTPNDIDARSV